MGGFGDAPEDRNRWFWESFPELLRKSLGKGFKKDFLGNEKDNIGAMVLRLAENYIMAPQDVVPAFARPFKITTPPGDGLLIPPDVIPPPPGTFYNGLQFRVPDNSAAVVTCIHQELESPAAYSDVNIRLFYRSSSCQFFNPHKPESTPCTIVLFQQEKVSLQWENNGVVNHYLKAELIGYYWGVDKPDKNQRGLKANTQTQG